MRIISRLYFCWFFILVLTASLHADEQNLATMGLDELMNVQVVYGASKYKQLTRDVPASITIITHEQIAKYNYRTLADALSGQRGFDITYDRNYRYLGLRGLNRPGDYNSRVLIAINGHRYNENIYDSTFIGDDFILDMSAVERIEIIRGPGSAIYGSNAFLAVVNVITKSSAEGKGTQVEWNMKKYGTHRGRLSYGGEHAGLELMANFAFYDSQGEDQFYPEYNDPATNNGVSVKQDGEKVKKGVITAKFQDLKIDIAYANRTKEIPTGSFESVFNDGREGTQDVRSYVDLLWEHSYDLFTPSIRAYYDSYYYEGDYPLDYPPITLSRDETNGKIWGVEARAVLSAIAKNKLSIGLEYRNNFQQDQKNFDVEPYVSYLDDKRKETIVAYYLQDEIRMSDSILINLGARYDSLNTSDINQFAPRGGIIYQHSLKTNLKALYGEAFRAPNCYERYYASPSSQKGNPNLKPETISTYEFILEQSLTRNLNLTVSLYEFTVQNMSQQIVDPNDGLQIFVNQGAIKSQGSEFEVEYKNDSGTEGALSYALAQAKDSTTKAIISNSPRHKVLSRMAQTFFNQKLTLAGELQYTGSTYAVDGSKVGDYYLVNLSARTLDLGVKDLTSFLRLTNLFDRKYGQPASTAFRQDTIEQDGINFELGVGFTF